MKFRYLSVCILMISAMFLVGCGSGPRTASANLSGKVLLNGEPVTGGTLAFHTADSGAYSAQIDEQGNYRAVDLPVGEVTVTVDNHYLDPSIKSQTYSGQGAGRPGGAASSKMGNNPMAAMYGKTMSGAGGGPAPAYKGKGVTIAPPPEGATIVKGGTYVPIPSIYQKQETSTIKITLVSGDNQKNIELTGK